VMMAMILLMMMKLNYWCNDGKSIDEYSCQWWWWWWILLIFYGDWREAIMMIDRYYWC
jgi:hypothetical protein